ncbi:hypothetical protein FO519_008955 [Halicephalobus sp. NKZ332]|nr:hypothetical protein FO519_008955 [Halicephalobus sp. NKZ332]
MKVFIFLLFCVFSIKEGFSFDCPQKDKMIKSIQSRLTNYLTSSQDVQVCGKLETQLWNNQTGEQIMSNFISTVLGVLTFSQTLSLGSKGLACSSQSGLSLTDLLGKVGGVLSNNTLPFLHQITSLMSNLRTKKNMQQSPVFITVYRKCNQFFLKKNVETIMCRMVDNFTPSQWTAIRNNLGSLFLMSLYPCTQQ